MATDDTENYIITRTITDDTEIYNMIHVSQVNYHTDIHGWPRTTRRIII